MILNQEKLPQVIILYGPPGAGKGTQAEKLLAKLENFKHLDFGTELRTFIKEHRDAQTPDGERARRMQEIMASKPVDTADLRYVVEHKIMSVLNSGQKLLVEGPGRKREEAAWLSDFFSKNNIDSCIFHIHVPLNLILKRVKNRYYIPNSNHPYPSLEEALKDCPAGSEPYQRIEDLDNDNAVRRYHSLYADHFAAILSIYQLNAASSVFTLDGGQSVDEVSAEIVRFINKFYSL